MFGSKKDPLVDVVKKVMEGNEVRRQVERDLNSELGIYSRQVLPNEHQLGYDRMLAEKTKIALNEGLKGGQVNLDLNGNKKLDPNDFKLLRGQKKAALEEGDSDNGTFTGAVTDTKTGKKVVSDTGMKADAPSVRSQADKDALTQKFKDASGEVNETKYSAKAGRAGEDLGKPGKNFKKIADKAGKEYGSEEAGKRVAGAILAKIRAKKLAESEQLDELTGKGKLGAIAKHHLSARGTSSDKDDYDDHNKKGSRAYGMMSNIAAKKAADDVFATYAPGKNRPKMPYKGPKYKAMEEESIDEIKKPLPSYIEKAEGELDRKSDLMKDVNKGDKDAERRMNNRLDGVFAAKRKLEKGSK